MSAFDAPFAAKDALRARGYRWNAEGRVWVREVGEGNLDAEIGWTIDSVYSGRGRPQLSRITWRERYST